MKLGQAVASFAQSAMVRGTFAESFYKGVRLDRQEGSSAYFKFTVPDLMCQQNGALSCGAANTIVDAVTTIHLVEKTLLKTISISLSCNYLSMDKRLGRELLIKSELSKLGKQICFIEAECWDGGQLVCSGSHVKKVLDSPWAFDP